MAKTRDKSRFWNYLLIGAFGVTAGVMVPLIAAAFIVPRAIDRAIDSYTDTAPEPGRAIEVTEAHYETLRERVDSFADSVDAGEPHESLVLTSEEVGAILQREVEKETAESGGDPRVRLWLRVEDGKLRGPISILMDDAAIGLLDHLRGRYLNGVATIDVSHADGQFRIALDNFEMDGEPIPEWLRGALQEEIDRAIANSQELRDAAVKLGGLELYDDKAVVHAKSPAVRMRKD